MDQPLIHDNIEFHNAAALEPLNGVPGLVPVRIPRDIRHQLNPRARFIGARLPGVELRFVTSAPKFFASFQAHEDAVELNAYCGGFHHDKYLLGPGETKVIGFDQRPEFNNVTPEAIGHSPFALQVWRIQIRTGICGFLGLDTLGSEVRPPLPEEKPPLRWLAYGSSITHSCAFGYPHQAAWRLGVDVLNKGLSGACKCEPVLADHFATKEKWDFMTMELGINMRGEYTPEAFDERARYLVRRMREAQPNAPLVLITHYMNRQHHASEADDNPLAVERQEAYDTSLRTIAKEYAGDNVHLFEGTEILTRFDGLMADLIHPDYFGNVQMGENLATRLEPIIDPLR